MANERRGVKLVLMCGAAVAALALSAAAQAAEQTAGAASEPAALQEVVVTAQRRTERLVDVPMSVTALTGDQVAKAGVVSLHDLGNVTAGVQVNFAGCCTQPAIRGISTLTTGIGYENNVATYVDGFYTPDNVTVNGDLANISSIEVLKGPQGTLWGRNATGGAILINTLAPSETFTGKVKASYGSYDDMSLSAYVSGPISERVRFGVAAYGRKSDGYNKLLGPDGERIGDATPLRQVSIRNKLEVDVTDQLTATLAYNYGLSSDGRGNLFTVMAFPNYPASPLTSAPPRASRPYTSSTNRETVLLGITDEGTLKLVYNTPVGTLTSYTGLAHRRTKLGFDFDASWADLTYSDQRWRQDTFQQGLDFSIDAIANLDLIVGATYYNDRLKTVAQNAYSQNRLTSTFSTTLKSEAWAGYVDGAYHVSDKLAVNLGVRYTYEEKRGHYVTVLPTGAPLGLPGENDADFDAITPRASIRYEVAPRSNVYASYAKGFRSGGFQPAGAADPTLYLPYDPEKISAYEVGFKTSGGWYRFDIAGFFYDYRDLQVGVTVPNPNGSGSLINTVINAKKAEVYGIDADVTVQPIDHLNVHAGFAWLHGRYKDFGNATGTGLNTATNRNVPNQAQDWSGKQMTRSPNFSAILGVDYAFQDVVGGELQVGTNIRYTDSYITNAASLYGPLAGALANKQRYRQGGYTLVNAQATWRDREERYELGVFANNLTDKEYRLTYSGGTFGDYSSWAQPRTVGVRVGYNF